MPNVDHVFIADWLDLNGIFVMKINFSVRNIFSGNRALTV